LPREKSAADIALRPVQMAETAQTVVVIARTIYMRPWGLENGPTAKERHGRRVEQLPPGLRPRRIAPSPSGEDVIN
jgi:hypothetical protein